MQANDARRLSHETLEALRERAVRQVQEGESPEAVARVFGLHRSTLNVINGSSNSMGIEGVGRTRTLPSFAATRTYFVADDLYDHLSDQMGE